MKFTAALDPDSTAGNFHGQLALKFSTRTDLSADGQHWKQAQVIKTFKAKGSNAKVTIKFTVGGEGPPFELNLYPSFSFADPLISSPQYDFQYFPTVIPSKFVPKQAGAVGDRWEYSETTNLIADSDTNPRLVGPITFSFSLPVTFDGTMGQAKGVWALKYGAAV